MSDPDEIDYPAVQRYFAQTNTGDEACASYMAHAQDLPENSVHYRFKKELATIRDWLDAVRPEARVLDLGCGSGAWTELFARRFGSVVAVEQSAPMLAAARTRLAPYSNVELLSQDVRAPLPPGAFDLVFCGGLCMYLSDADTVALVGSVAERLETGGRVVLRESTVQKGRERADGEYEAVYRSVDIYRSLLREAGISSVCVRRNYAYTYMEIAVELVELRRRYLSLLPRTSPWLGALTWWSLRATSPLSFGILPRVAARLGIAWPRLQNHFFMLESTQVQAAVGVRSSS